jgi:hypothetical protein
MSTAKHLVCRALFGLALILSPIMPLVAQDTSSGLEVAEPKALGVGVAGVDASARAIGLSIERLRDAIDAGLWRAGIDKNRVGSEPLFLGLRVHVLGDEFVVSLEFHRWVSYRVGDEIHRSSAIVWRRERTGSHQGDADAVTAATSDLVDEFLQEYRRANRGRL